MLILANRRHVALIASVAKLIVRPFVLACRNSSVNHRLVDQNVQYRRNARLTKPVLIRNVLTLVKVLLVVSTLNVGLEIIVLYALAIAVIPAMLSPDVMPFHVSCEIKKKIL